jgi:hypothetical protein
MKKNNSKNQGNSNNHSKSEPKLINEVCPESGKITIITDEDLMADEVPMWECQCDCGNIAHVSENALLSEAAECCGHCRGHCKCNEGKQKKEEAMADRKENNWQKQEAAINAKKGYDVYFYNDDETMRYIGKCLGHRQFFPGTLELSLSENAPILQPLMIEDDGLRLWELAYWAEIKSDLPTFRIGAVDYYNEVMALKYTGIDALFSTPM